MENGDEYENKDKDTHVEETFSNAGSVSGGGNSTLPPSDNSEVTSNQKKLQGAVNTSSSALETQALQKKLATNVNGGKGGIKLPPTDSTKLSKEGKTTAGLNENPKTGTTRGDASMGNKELSYDNKITQNPKLPKTGSERNHNNLEEDASSAVKSEEWISKTNHNNLEEDASSAVKSEELISKTNHNNLEEDAQTNIGGKRGKEEMDWDKEKNKIYENTLFFMKPYEVWIGEDNKTDQEYIERGILLYKDGARIERVFIESVNKYFGRQQPQGHPVYAYRKALNELMPYNENLKEQIEKLTGKKVEVAEKDVGREGLIDGSLRDGKNAIKGQGENFGLTETQLKLSGENTSNVEIVEVGTAVASTVVSAVGMMVGLVAETNPVYGIISNAIKLFGNIQVEEELEKNLDQLKNLKKDISAINEKEKNEKNNRENAQILRIIDLAIASHGRRRQENATDAVSNVFSLVGDVVSITGLVPLGWVVKGIGFAVKGISAIYHSRKKNKYMMNVIEEQLIMDGSLRKGERKVWMARMDLYKKHGGIKDTKAGEAHTKDKGERERYNKLKNYDPDPLKTALDKKHISDQMGKGFNADHTWYEKILRADDYQVSNDAVANFYTDYIDGQVSWMMKNKTSPMMVLVFEAMGYTFDDGWQKLVNKSNGMDEKAREDFILKKIHPFAEQIRKNLL